MAKKGSELTIKKLNLVQSLSSIVVQIYMDKEQL